ncbi:MAG: HD-GYP domain-containing protein [Acidobacteria bacterium]|nr:HD-GYP domain-containing protein [Acidobacteriota bacterium]
MASAIRAHALYSAGHPLAKRSVDGLSAALAREFRVSPSLAIGFLGDDIIVGNTKLKRSASLGGLARHFQDRQVEKLVFSSELTADGLEAIVGVLADRDSRPLQERLGALHVTGCGVGTITADPAPTGDLGVNAAKQLYGTAVQIAEGLWGAAEAGSEPDPDAAQTIIDSLAKAVSQDRASMVALTSIKSHDAYTFSHMVNVSLLTMAQARTLGIHGSLLREFGLAGLMHDIGKVKIPPEILNKPGKLTDEEMGIVKRHVIDGAQILRRTPNVPSLAAVVAFEHHLRQDLSGYPEKIGHRKLNLCTMLVSISDVFDALRTNRSYREGLPAARVRAMLAEQSGTSFEPTLLRRFVTLMGLFPVGTFVRVQNGDVGVVTEEHPSDPFRPQVRLVADADGRQLPKPRLLNTWERDDRGEHPFTVVEAVDGSAMGFNALALMAS